MNFHSLIDNHPAMENGESASLPIDSEKGHCHELARLLRFLRRQAQTECYKIAANTSPTRLEMLPTG